MKASEIKRGSVVEVDGAVVYITELQVQTASSRSGSTLDKVKGRNVISRQNLTQGEVIKVNTVTGELMSRA